MNPSNLMNLQEAPATYILLGSSPHVTPKKVPQLVPQPQLASIQCWTTTSHFSCPTKSNAQEHEHHEKVRSTETFWMPTVLSYIVPLLCLIKQYRSWRFNIAAYFYHLTLFNLSSFTLTVATFQNNFVAYSLHCTII